LKSEYCISKVVTLINVYYGLARFVNMYTQYKVWMWDTLHNLIGNKIFGKINI